MSLFSARRVGIVGSVVAVVGVLALSGTANAAPLAAFKTTIAQKQVPAAGQACIAAALRVVPATAKNAHIACGKNLLTSSIPAGGATKELVTDLASGKTVDVTGMDSATAKSSVARAFQRQDSGAGTVKPMFGEWYIDDQYHAHTDENLYYAIVTNGVVTFISWVKMTSRIGLQFRYHYFNLSFTQLENRPVTVTVNVKSREDISFWPDRTVEEDLYGNASYQTQWSQDGFLHTDTDGVFYWELDDRQINDEEMGQFSVMDDFEAPHFRCYKTVPCKYPNGQEA
jgi:hypothetical protein